MFFHLFKVISVRKVVLTVTSTTHPSNNPPQGLDSDAQPTFASASRGDQELPLWEGSQAFFELEPLAVLLFPSSGLRRALRASVAISSTSPRIRGQSHLEPHPEEALLKANSLRFSWRKDHAMLPQCFTQARKPQGNWRLQLVKYSHLCERLLTDLKCK